MVTKKESNRNMLWQLNCTNSAKYSPVKNADVMHPTQTNICNQYFNFQGHINAYGDKGLFHFLFFSAFYNCILYSVPRLPSTSTEI